MGRVMATHGLRANHRLRVACVASLECQKASSFTPERNVCFRIILISPNAKSELFKNIC